MVNILTGRQNCGVWTRRRGSPNYDRFRHELGVRKGRLRAGKVHCSTHLVYLLIHDYWFKKGTVTFFSRTFIYSFASGCEAQHRQGRATGRWRFTKGFAVESLSNSGLFHSTSNLAWYKLWDIYKFIPHVDHNHNSFAIVDGWGDAVTEIRRTPESAIVNKRKAQ